MGWASVSLILFEVVGDAGMVGGMMGSCCECHGIVSTNNLVFFCMDLVLLHFEAELRGQGDGRGAMPMRS